MEINKLYAYLDCTAFDEAQLVGVLRKERIPGKEAYSFEFSPQWLKNHGELFIDPDLMPYSGLQYVPNEKPIFGLFQDSLPDRWGHLLLERREKLISKIEKRSPRSITGFEALALINDFGRRGGLRFKTDPNGEYSNTDQRFATPPFARLRELEDCIANFEEAESKHLDPKAKWLMDLVDPGTSLGGARPKANVVDEDGNLWVAKFPSRNDIYDHQQWEQFAHLLGKRCGVKVAETKTIKGVHGDILLSKRFDRTLDGQRIHMASAMTMCGLCDGSKGDSGHGYLDIVDSIVQHSSSPDQDLMELYRRVAFNICVGNSDDHFRNHSFLLDKNGWRLSPAYDMNPTDSQYQALNIDQYSNEASLKNLLDASDDYMIGKQDALAIIEDVQYGVANWKVVANQAGIPKNEQSMFGYRFDEYSQLSLSGLGLK